MGASEWGLGLASKISEREAGARAPSATFSLSSLYHTASFFSTHVLLYVFSLATHATSAAPRTVHTHPTRELEHATFRAHTMLVQVPVILLLLVNEASSESLATRGSGSVRRVAHRVRREAEKRSSGIIEDLQLAWSGFRQQKQTKVLASQKLFCVNTADGFAGLTAPQSNSTSIPSPTTATTRSNPPPTSTAPPPPPPPPPPSPPPSSSWKIAQSYVRTILHKLTKTYS